MRHAFAVLALALWAGQALGNTAASSAQLRQQQKEAQQQQEQLRERIEALSRDIRSSEASRRDAADQLRASEEAISTLNRELANLENQKDTTEKSLKQAQVQQREQKAALEQRRRELADQLRAQYAAGLSPWTALLSGDNPQAISRDLRYLGYVSQAQAQAVQNVQKTIHRLAELEKAIKDNRTTLERLSSQMVQRKKDLEAQKGERKKVLARIESELKDQQTQAQRMEQNDARLGKLITGLDKTIEQQREAERIAAEKKRAEQARLAAERRRQEQERRRLEAEQREQARLAAQQARPPSAVAVTPIPGTEATLPSSSDTESVASDQSTDATRQAQGNIRETVRVTEPPVESATTLPVTDADLKPQAVRKPDPEPATTQVATVAADGVPGPVEPSGGFGGLRKGLPSPLKPTNVLGRFGNARPDGGVWRGIVMMAPEGTPVKAVASGRVVYSTWMSGFGNIIILDHGDKYLSVYAYNQALLKQVGDTVKTGDILARVGATGGQVEPGLYFELRHQGSPINPQVWLKR